MVVAPAQELIAPLQETVDAIPIPGLSVLIDLPALLQETVADIEENALLALLSGSVNDIKNSINAASIEMGVANISLD
jgi:hypothetical protein